MDSEQLHRLLSDRQWLRRFSAAIQGRARAYLRSGRVLRLAVVESLDDLAVLEAHVQGRRKTPYLARAVVQAQAFETLAAHYPVYFERASGRPLERGEDRRLAMHWPLQLDGSQRLVTGFEGDGKGHLLFSGAGLWYADPAGGRFGRVEGNPALPGQLARAPALPPEQVAAFRKRTAERKPALVLPEPIEPPPLRVIEQAPVPVLHLTIQALPPLRHGYKRWPAQTVGTALLTFDYEGVRIAPDDPVPCLRRLVEGEIREVRRNHEAEQAIAARLLRQGLRDLDTLFYAHGRIPNANGKWLVLQPDQRRPPELPETWRPTLDALAAEGARIEYEPDFPRQRLVESGEWYAEVDEDGGSWFDLRLGIDLDGERVDLLPILRRLLEDPAFPLTAPRREKPDATWVVPIDMLRSIALPLARLRALIAPLLEWLHAEPGGALRLHRTQAEMLSTLPLRWRGDEALRRRVLLFSQFTEMLDLLRHDLDARKVPHLILTGDTPARTRTGLVRRFQQGEAPLFLISLKAGGVGLNLTAADTVVHYDPWWNPAVENQATDRAHRIGQNQPVFVYKLICAGTVEEKIQALQARNAGLAQAVLEGGSSKRLRFDEGDLEALFAPL